jgi:hypothetical protein
VLGIDYALPGFGAEMVALPRWSSCGSPAASGKQFPNLGQKANFLVDSGNQRSCFHIPPTMLRISEQRRDLYPRLFTRHSMTNSASFVVHKNPYCDDGPFDGCLLLRSEGRRL